MLSLLIMAMFMFNGCKLHRENTNEDKFGRAIGKISAELAGQIDVAIKKFVKNGGH